MKRWAPKGYDFAAIRADRTPFPDGPPSELGAELARISDAGLRDQIAAAHAKQPRTEPTERQILGGIVRGLERAGYVCHRMTSGVFQSDDRTVRTGEPGMPDLLVELPGGRCAWLEVKTASGRVRTAQEAWHAKARARGQHVAVVRTAEEAFAFVRGLQ